MSADELTDAQPSWTIPQALRRQLLAALSSQPEHAVPRLTYEEFLEWIDEDTLAEWVDGEVIMTSPASVRHQDIVNFLVGVLSAFVRIHKLGRILDGPFQMKLARSGREPDLLYVSPHHMERLKPTFLDGPADLVVEVVSPESMGRDRGDKFYEYQEARIPEYWLIDPQTEQCEFYQLDAKGRYHAVPPDTDGIYRSAVLPGIWLRESWLWQDPPPSIEDVLLDFDGEAYARYMLERLRQRGFGQMIQDAGSE